MSTITNPKIIDYLSTVKDQISLTELKGYLPVDAVIDAYTTGEKDGKNQFFDKLVDKITNNTIQHYLYTTYIVKAIQDKKYDLFAVYICPKENKSIISTSEQNVVDDDFIKFFYDQAFKFENQFLSETGTDMHISFIPCEHIDEEELELDNYVKIYEFEQETTTCGA